ncbi:MAG: DUF1054 domain-containing protein [Streptococcaceae bacterium]|jgi:uncharacterized protein YktB (UPF0637 family)|nr:DUF1054 domain-containing protein [Streptococcaceae bacterium]
MFDLSSFKVFEIDGLKPRLDAIRCQIQPDFQTIGEKLCELVNQATLKPSYLHIAQHRRRTTHAPENTWCAISTQKRGYKMEPHFQLGIWQDYVFIYLSMIDQPKGQKAYAKYLLEHQVMFDELSNDFVYSINHTVKDFFPLENIGIESALKRLEQVKKSEFEVGKVYQREIFELKKEQEILNDFSKTITALLPIYQDLMNVRKTVQNEG